MSETSIEKKRSSVLKEKTQYAAAFGVIALMLFAAGFPLFLLFFVGAITFFIWKVFSSEGRGETRRVFEFYLLANEILRDNDRRWYGFEIQEAIDRGESAVRSMKAAPPLVHFSLGALYQKIGDHDSALRNLKMVVDDGAASESSIVYPTRELREYVRMLRKIERNPAEVPLTSAAIRSLERSRKNRSSQMLEECRKAATESSLKSLPEENRLESVVDVDEFYDPDHLPAIETEHITESNGHIPEPKRDDAKTVEIPGSRSERKEVTERKTISEVLQDIYE